MADYDLAIIGGGLTGAGIARDAAGRGLSVLLIEQGDLASGASSASTGLIAGDLEQFKRRAFLRVRTGLAERNLLLKIAPHLVRPVSLVMPVDPDERSPWRSRSELFLYDRLAPAPAFPRSSVAVPYGRTCPSVDPRLWHTDRADSRRGAEPDRSRPAVGAGSDRCGGTPSDVLRMGPHRRRRADAALEACPCNFAAGPQRVDRIHQFRRMTDFRSKSCGFGKGSG